MGRFIEQLEDRYALRLFSSCVSSRDMSVSFDTMIFVSCGVSRRKLLLGGHNSSFGHASSMGCFGVVILECTLPSSHVPVVLLPLTQLMEACYNIQPVPNSRGTR